MSLHAPEAPGSSQAVDRAVQHIAWQTRVVEGLGLRLRPGARVLDFGCGDGTMVDACASAGYEAYGCDIEIVEPSDRLRPLDLDDYRIPFEDDFFDLVFSSQVFEHVQNPGAAFAELARVQKPDGLSLHVFPPRYRPVEPHVHVPLGTVVRHPAWLRLWARLGVRNEFQKDLTAEEVARRNHEYLLGSTNYLRRGEILRFAGRYFEDARFVENVVLATSPRATRILGGPLVGAAALAFGGLYMRVLACRSPR